MKIKILSNREDLISKRGCASAISITRRIYEFTLILRHEKQETIGLDISRIDGESNYPGILAEKNSDNTR